MSLFVKIISGIILLFGSGYVATRIFVHDGLAELHEPDQRNIAVEALKNRPSLLGNDWTTPWYDRFLPKIQARVENVIEGNCSSGEDTYFWTIRVYTLFAIPLRTFQSSCEGIGLEH